MENLKTYNEFREDNYLLEMANISKNKTGLNYIVWVQTKLPGGYANGKHNKPRLKVQVNNSLVPISIDKNPEILGNIAKNNNIERAFKEVSIWIQKNYDSLIELWNGNILSDEFIDKIKKV